MLILILFVASIYRNEDQEEVRELALDTLKEPKTQISKA